MERRNVIITTESADIFIIIINTRAGGPGKSKQTNKLRDFTICLRSLNPTVALFSV